MNHSKRHLGVCQCCEILVPVKALSRGECVSACWVGQCQLSKFQVLGLKPKFFRFSDVTKYFNPLSLVEASTHRP